MEVLKLPFLQVLGSLYFVDLVNFTLQKVQILKKLKFGASKCVKMTEFTVWKNEKFTLTERKISSNQLFSTFFSKPLLSRNLSDIVV